MKITIQPEKLAEALAIARRAVGKGNVNPIWGSVLLEATTDGGLVISGTDLETRAWHTVSAQVDEAGAVALPPSGLVNFLEVCPPDATITLAVNDKHKAELTCGRALVKLAGFDPEQFPAATTFDEPSWDLTIGAPLLADLLDGVAHAVAPDRSREVLAGILVQVRDGRLTLAAADGYRLAVRATDIEGAPDCSVVVRGRALAGAGKAFAQATSARLIVDARQSALLIDTEVGCWAIRLIEGQFPDFSRIVPRETTVRVTVSRDRLLAVCRLARQIEQSATQNGKRSTFNSSRLTVGENSLQIRAHDDAGDHEAEVELDAEVEGGPLVIGFNGDYLAQAIEALPGPRVCLGMNRADSPAVFTQPGSRDNLQVTMPMHVARP